MISPGNQGGGIFIGARQRVLETEALNLPRERYIFYIYWPSKTSYNQREAPLKMNTTALSKTVKFFADIAKKSVQILSNVAMKKAAKSSLASNPSHIS